MEKTEFEILNEFVISTQNGDYSENKEEHIKIIQHCVSRDYVNSIVREQYEQYEDHAYLLYGLCGIE